MEITMNGIKYALNEEGITESVSITYNNYDGKNSLNATVTVLPEHLTGGKTLDELGKKELDAQARQLLKSWF